MYPMHKICRAFDRRDPADKITDILLQKQLEQIDKAQRCFAKEITAQQNLTKRRFDDKVLRTENGYAKLWESKNMTNIWLELNQDMSSYSPTESRGGRKSSQKKNKCMLVRGKTELGTSSTGGGYKDKDSTAPKTTETVRSNTSGHKPKFQRNVTFLNSRTLPVDLGDNPKVTPIRPSRNEMKNTEYYGPSKVVSWRSGHSASATAGKHRRQNCLQSHCWGSKFFSNRRTPRRHNEYRRYSKIGSPTKNFLGGVDVSECFANISLNRNSENYETKIRDFCDSLKNLIITSTSDN